MISEISQGLRLMAEWPINKRRTQRQNGLNQGQDYLKWRTLLKKKEKKDNATNKAKGKPAWIISVRAFKNNTKEWLSVYHLRSIVESVFSSIKKRWGSFLRSRQKWMQRKELSLKVLSYNVKQVLLVQYAEECKIPLWKTLE